MKVEIPNSILITLSGQTSRGVKGIEVREADGHLIFTLTDGKELDMGSVMGPQGPKGDTGAKGEKGDSGAKGDTGATGAKGEKGDKGDKGDTGATGAQGEQGAQGLQGERGEKGEKGNTGAKGDPGTDGTTPTIGANGNWYLGTTDTGKPSRGAKGDKGDQGEQGIQGIRGEQGIQGERGLQGIQGEKGEKGDTGSGFKVLGYYATAAALSAAVANPEAGMAYGVGTAEPYDIYIYDSVSKSWKNNGPLQGAKGDTGVGVANVTFDDDIMTVNLTSGAHYSSGSLRGPQGVKGDAGAKGDPGATGPQGPAGKTPEKGTDYFTAADKSEIAEDAAALVTVPTKVSELTNDANYITADQAPVKSVNGKTGNVTVSTTFVAYRLGNSSATCTFAEMLEAWKRGDICILRYGADGMLEYQLFAVVDNESITFTYVDGDIIREIVWTADGNFTDNNIEKSTNLSASSTNSQFPTSKAVWDSIPHPETKTNTQTQTVGVDNNGKLWTAPPPVTSVNGKTGDVAVSALPTVGTADNGKFLRVVSGAWAAAEIANANGGSF